MAAVQRVASGLRPSAGDVDFVVEDPCAVAMPLRPDHPRLELLPVLAVLRIPDVVGVVGPGAAEEPHAIAVDDRREPAPCMPRRLVGQLRPLAAIAAGPDILVPPGAS